MGISTRPLPGLALAGLCLLSLQSSPAAAQGIGGGFRSGGNPPGSGMMVPRVNPMPNQPMQGSPVGSLMTSPYGPAVGTIGTIGTSPYAPDNPAANPFYGSYILPDPYGGYLRGAADVTNANGRFLVQTQQALQIKEQTRTMMIDNRRKLFDEWLYERANTPTGEEERMRAQQQRLMRAMNDPTVNEISNGQTLNELLRQAQKIQAALGSRQGPTVPVEPFVLARLSLTTGRGNNNTALLKDEGNITWPSGLRDLLPAQESQELREAAQNSFRKAFDEVKAGGQPGPGTLRDFNMTLTRLQNMVRQNAIEMTTTNFVEARRFIDQLRGASQFLERPNAAEELGSSLRPQGKDVGEVVQFMSNRGLFFAPAGPGAEGAYTAMHRGLVSFITQASFASGQ